MKKVEVFWVIHFKVLKTGSLNLPIMAATVTLSKLGSSNIAQL